MIFPQDSLTLEAVLPPSPDTVRDTMAVMLIGPTVRLTTDNVKKWNPCLIRKSRVSTLIQFLVDNNPYYALDTTFSGYSAANLDALSANSTMSLGGDSDIFVPAGVEIISLDPTSHPAELDVTADYTSRNLADPRDAHLADEHELLLENVGYTWVIRPLQI